MMIDEGIILGLAGFLLVVFIILLDSYWKETKEHYTRALDKKRSKKERKLHAENYRRSMFMFRIIALGMLVCLLSVFVAIFIPINFSKIISIILLFFAFLFLIIFLIFMILGYYYIIYLKPKDLLNLIQEDC